MSSGFVSSGFMSSGFFTANVLVSVTGGEGVMGGVMGSEGV